MYNTFRSASAFGFIS